jgi:uncharacterized repeat protein (TIGR02543 family)
VNWTGDGGFVATTANPLIVSNVKSAQTVTANFAIDTFAVKFLPGSNGSLNGIANQTINYNDSASAITAVPAIGYHFVNWTGDGGFVTTTANPLIITNVASAQSVTANFATDTFAVKFFAGSNGSFTGTASQTINYNDSTSTVTAVPATGYHFVNWTGDGGFVTATANPLTVSSVKSAQSITANFAIDTFVVTPSVGVGSTGSISPSSSQTVNFNATTSFTVTPMTGYLIASVSGCGGSLSGSTYTTAAVTANCTVTAAFSLIPPPVYPSGDITGDGQVDVSDALKVLRIVVGLVTATPEEKTKADVAPLENGKPSPDGVIDIADALLILQKAVGLVSW